MTRSTRIVVLLGLMVALVLAGVVSHYASSSPDGLNRVAVDEGFAKGEKAHPLGDSPLSGYAVKGVDDDRLSGGLAGMAGVGATFALGAALTMAVRRKGEPSAEQPHADQGGAGGPGR